MVRHLAALLLSVLAFGLTGCAKPPLLHVPDPHPTPLLTEAGDAQLMLGGLILPGRISREVVVEGALQGAVSPVRHLGVFGSASHVSGVEHSHHYAEAGAVLYGSLGETLRGEVLVGGGRGDVEGEGTVHSISTSLEPYTATAKLERVFVQGNVWWPLGHVQPGLTLRVARVRFFETEGLRGREVGSFRTGYLEPGFFVRSGHRPVSVGMHLSFSLPFAEPHTERGDELYRSRPFSLGIDVALDLGHFFRAKTD